MENDIKKCSLKKHSKINGEYYCQECKINLCNKCQEYHSELFDDHHLFNIEQNIKDLFDDICQIENHSQKLEYFCKTHNQLCCMACLCKIKDKGNGQHKDCDVCIIENIKEEKKNILNENIQFLEDLSINIEQSINELKILFEKINKDKDILKLEIQNIFTNIRNTLNEREAKLLHYLLILMKVRNYRKKYKNY